MRSRDLFNHREVTLEYRPVVGVEDVAWYWVLLPASNSRALACGSATTKGRASIQARAQARRLGKQIVKVVTRQARGAGHEVTACSV